MSHRVGFPFFERVDALLHEHILLGHVRVFCVIFAPEHLFLLLKIGIFASQAKQVKIENRVLLCKLNNLVLHRILVVGLDSSQSRLDLLELLPLLLNQLLSLSLIFLKQLLFLLIVALNTQAVFVKLVLGEQIAPNLLIQVLNVSLLVLDLLVLSVVQLEGLFQLQLQEGVLPDIGLSDTMLACLIMERNLAVVKFVRVASRNFIIIRLTRLRRPKPARFDVTPG